MKYWVPVKQQNYSDTCWLDVECCANDSSILFASITELDALGDGGDLSEEIDSLSDSITLSGQCMLDAISGRFVHDAYEFFGRGSILHGTLVNLYLFLLPFASMIMLVIFHLFPNEA